MDEDFRSFLRKMGPAFDRRQVPGPSIARYRGRLPDQLLKHWCEHGWCGYADGLFWTVDPQAYEPALEAWIGGTRFRARDTYHVIARGAFGNLYLWGERSGFTLLVSPLGSYAVPRMPPMVPPQQRVQMFFASRDRDEDDFAGYFAPALARLGRLSAHEIYAFVPALALGGRSKFEHLQKVRAVEHLVFLARLSELQVLATAPR